MSCKRMEARAIERIRGIMNRLDETGENLETAYDRVNSFFEREKAIHEMQDLIDEVKEAKSLETRRKGRMQKGSKSAGEALEDIAGHLKRLETTFGDLDNVDSKTKVYLEQKKTLHEVKRILYYMGKYDAYQELDDICC